MLTYKEYELLSRIVDEHILAREKMLLMKKDDIIATVSFLSPNVNDNDVEMYLSDMLSNTESEIKSLEVIKEKIFLSL